MAFHIIRNDITKVKADAIVNTANPKPEYGTGTDLAIYKAAGEKLMLKARKAKGDMAEGEIYTTPGYNLPARYVIHAVGPVWKDGKSGELELLRGCYEKSMAEAVRLQCQSIAFPLMASGNNGIPNEQALQIAVSTITMALITYDIEVYLVIFSKETFRLASRIFPDIDTYIDDIYVNNAFDIEYELSHMNRNMPSDASDRERSRAQRWAELKARTTAPVSIRSAKPTAKDPDIWEILDEETQKKVTPFYDKLAWYINNSGLSSTQIYKSCGMTKSTYSKIYTACYQHDYNLSKSKIISLCIALKLNLAQTEELLGLRGYTFGDGIPAESFIRSCIANKIYGFDEIDSILWDNWEISLRDNSLK